MIAQSQHNHPSARARRLLRAALIVLALAAVACAVPGLRGLFGGTPAPEATPTVDVAQLPPTEPKVVAHRPFTGEELTLDGSVDIYFDQPMDRTSVEAALTFSPQVAVDMQWVDDETLRVTPRTGQLARAAHYTLTIAAGVKASNGLSMADPVEVEIQTVGFLEVSDVVPAPDTQSVETDSVITVIFNRPVVPLGITEQAAGLPQPLTISPDVSGSGEWLSTSIYQWKPDPALAGSTTYTVTVAGGLEDQTGGVLEEPYSWQFTTLPPDVISVEPGATDQVPLDTAITIEFNQAMDRASTEAAFSLSGGGIRVTGSFGWNDEGSTLTFSPSRRLDLSTSYTVSVASSARSAAGSATLIRDVTWTFDTVPAPFVASTRPFDGMLDVQVYDGITIYFSAPMDEDSLEGKLVTEPALPEDAMYFYNSYDRSWVVYGMLEPSTTYRVTLLAGASDPYGNRIEQPYTFSFTTGPLSPQVGFNTSDIYGLYNASRTTELFVMHRNVSRINFTLARISFTGFVQVSGDWDLLINYAPDASEIVREWTLQSTGGLNELVYNRVPIVSEQGGSLAPGAYLLIADAPEIEGTLRHLMLVVTANLTLKTTFDETLVWLTDLESGQPVAGVPVRLVNSGLGQMATGTTGRDGTAALEHAAGLAYLWERMYAVAEGDGVFAVGGTAWDEGIQPWQFGSISSRYEPRNSTIYLYTDRPLYRTGQEVYFKGIVRAVDDMAYSIVSDQPIDMAVYDSQGEIIYQAQMPVNEFGTFNGSFALDAEANLGYYSINANIPGQDSFGLGFQVAEYRKPEFQVTATPQADQVVAGDEVVVDVEAGFFSGGPVSDARVTWSVLSGGYFFEYTGQGNYSFWDYDFSFFDEPVDVPGFGNVIAEGEGTTDGGGRFTIRVPASLDDEGSSRTFTIEAVVEDINGLTVAGRTEVVVHKGEYYVGVSPDSYIATAGEPVTASLIVVDWNSEPVRNQSVSVQLVSVEWNNVREEDEFGRTQWVWDVVETPVSDAITVRTDRDGQATVSFTPPEGGSYKIRATVADTRGNQQRASAFVWVSSDAFVVWRQSNDNRIELVADRDTYAPGDTAEILIASPFQGSDVKALVTVERGGVLSHEVITLTSNSTVYRLPITGSLAPNMYVSVVIVKGVDSSNPYPAFRMGLIEIAVTPVEQTLTLTVTPSSPTVGPREQVTYTVEARDFRGNPVDAEVSLALVDLATLSLAGPNSRPIVDQFYGRQPLSVRTAVPLVFLVERINQQLIDQGKGGGGGGDEAFFDVRTEFEDTAFWTATLRTGADGVETVAVTLPDNLTTWRMDARAVTAGTLVGSATVDVVATRPLLIRPFTPRFFVVSDEAVLTAVVQNNTDRDIRADVTLEARGAALSGDASQRVQVPAGGRVEVAWPVTVDATAEWVDLVFAVEGGGFNDASRPPLGDPAHEQMLPVYRYDVPETVGTGGQLTGAETRIEGVVLPPTYDVQQGTLLVEIDPSLAAATVDALDWLEHFPYECTEQTVSRFLPNAMTLQALRELGIQDAELEANLRAQLGLGLQRLYSQQHVDGGWGWFMEGASNPMVTAYVVQGMVAAQKAGYPVAGRVLAAAITYLQSELVTVSTLSEQAELHRQAYILYVLADAGVADASRTGQLYDVRGNMQHYARALVAQSLWLMDPGDSRLATLQSDLVNAAILSATGAHWEEDSADWFNWNTDTRSTAIILDTFAKVWPQSELAPNIVRWLMVARQGGHWETTQETAWALIGLTNWMKVTGELDASYTWSLEFNGQGWAEGEASAATVRQPSRITIDVTQMLRDEVNRLAFTRGEGTGRLYYTAHLTAYLPVEEVQPLSRGVIVSRRYLDENGTPTDRGRVGDTLTVEVTVIAPHDLYYVVVEDPYPAGAEAVNTDLLTESLLGQRPVLEPDDPLARGWGWWWFTRADLRDEKAVLFADYLPAGTYTFKYEVRLAVQGTYRVIPPTAREFYFPEVYGRGAGSMFTIDSD